MFVLTYNKKNQYKNIVYELLQCKITQKYIFYVVFFSYVNNCLISFLFFLMFSSTFEVSQN
jgi:hypothetical protein